MAKGENLLGMDDEYIPGGLFDLLLSKPSTPKEGPRPVPSVREATKFVVRERSRSRSLEAPRGSEGSPIQLRSGPADEEKLRTRSRSRSGHQEQGVSNGFTNGRSPVVAKAPARPSSRATAVLTTLERVKAAVAGGERSGSSVASRPGGEAAIPALANMGERGLLPNPKRMPKKMPRRPPKPVGTPLHPLQSNDTLDALVPKDPFLTDLDLILQKGPEVKELMKNRDEQLLYQESLEMEQLEEEPQEPLDEVWGSGSSSSWQHPSTASLCFAPASDGQSGSPPRLVPKPPSDPPPASMMPGFSRLKRGVPAAPIVQEWPPPLPAPLPVALPDEVAYTKHPQEPKADAFLLTSQRHAMAVFARHIARLGLGKATGAGANLQEKVIRALKDAVARKLPLPPCWSFLNNHEAQPYKDFLSLQEEFVKIYQQAGPKNPKADKQVRARIRDETEKDRVQRMRQLAGHVDWSVQYYLYEATAAQERLAGPVNALPQPHGDEMDLNPLAVRFAHNDQSEKFGYEGSDLESILATVVELLTGQIQGASLPRFDVCLHEKQWYCRTGNRRVACWRMAHRYDPERFSHVRVKEVVADKVFTQGGTGKRAKLSTFRNDVKGVKCEGRWLKVRETGEHIGFNVAGEEAPEYGEDLLRLLLPLFRRLEDIGLALQEPGDEAPLAF